MGKYSIKELESLSGIKAHTLRIWEKRFNLLNPKRTETNIRYYSDEDLRKILNVSILTSNGVRISEVASFSEDEMRKAIMEINDQELVNLKRVNELIIAMSEYDEKRFNQLYDRYVADFGFETTFTDVIYPYLEKVGILWLSGEVQATQEHLISALIRAKLICATEDLPFPEKAKKSAILFLPEGEYHELGLLFFNYLLRKHGIKSYYLGQSSPLRQTINLIDDIQPDFSITYSIVKSKKEVEEYLNQLSGSRTKNLLYVENKHQAYLNIEYPRKVQKLTHYQDLLEAI